MKGVLKLEDGRELAVEIDENTFKSVEEPKKTGHERSKNRSTYYYIDYAGQVTSDCDCKTDADNDCYEIANYYSDKTVAENNARADLLMRKLRRFSLKRQKDGVSWDNRYAKYCILFDHLKRKLFVMAVSYTQSFGQVYFETLVDAEDAIKEFETELLWYFKEYKDSL